MIRRAGYVICAAIFLASCGNLSPPRSGLPRISTTVSPITDLVGQVACGAVEVAGIVPEGVNSHTFEPRPTDAVTLAGADLVIANGLNLEIPTIELARANIGDDVAIIELGPAVLSEDRYIYDFSFPLAGGDPNPHIWTDPTLAIEMVKTITVELSRIAPSQSGVFEANARRLIDALHALDEATVTATGTVDAGDRKLLTYHDSFPYFARTYGWEVIGAIQPADFSEPSPREVAALIDQIRQQKVKAIFGSEVFPSPVLEQIAAETGTIYVDDLRDDDLPGEAGDPEHTYLALMVSNLTTIVESLGGDAAALADVPTTSVCEHG